MFGAAKFEVISPHSLVECVERLGAATDPDWSEIPTERYKRRSAPPGTKAVIGEVQMGMIQLRKRIRGSNSFQTTLRADLRRSVNGTRFLVTCGMHPHVQLFAWCDARLLERFLIDTVDGTRQAAA